MVVTGVTKDKGETHGKAIFFDRNTFNRVYEIPLEGAVSALFSYFDRFFCYLVFLTSVKRYGIAKNPMQWSVFFA